MQLTFLGWELSLAALLLLAQPATSAPQVIDPNYTWSDKRDCRIQTKLQQNCSAGTVETFVNFGILDANDQPIYGLNGPGIGQDKYHPVYDVDGGVGTISNTQGFNMRWKYYEGRLGNPPSEWEKMTFHYIGDPAGPRNDEMDYYPYNPATATPWKVWDQYNGKNLEWAQGCASGAQIPTERVRYVQSVAVV
jgi:hypothetical protein